MGVVETDDGDTRRYIDSYGNDVIDTQGIYRGGDSKGDMFKFLWLLADTRPVLSGLSYSSLATTSTGCHWCSATAVGTCMPENASPVLYRPAGSSAYAQLVLPKPCTGNGCCVNAFGNKSSDSSRLDLRGMDVVSDIKAFRPLADTVCPVDPAADATTNLLWKKGADSGSATFTDVTGEAYPVKMQVGNTSTAVAACDGSKNTAEALINGCSCSAVEHTELWRHDAFDAMAVDANYFKATFEELLTTDVEKQKILLSTVGIWKETVLQTADIMVLWQARLARWIQLINDWQAGSYKDSQSWCVPVNSGDVTATEASAILTGGAWGSLGSVIACLEYNEGATTAFNNCAVLCAGCTTATLACPATACDNLPRSLVPGFDSTTTSGKPVCSTDGATGKKICTAATGSYLANIQESSLVSVNQVAKFTARKLYLKDMNTKIQAVKVALQDAQAYLSSAPDTLKQLVADINTAQNDMVANAAAVAAAAAAAAAATPSMATITKATSLGSQVIYGWFSLRPDDWSSAREYGYLHIIKVEAAMPNRSTGAAGFNTCTDKFPWIKTYTKGFLGSTRCYELTDASGCVGLRVVRYDEDHDLNANGFLKFLGGVSLWRIIYHNPHGNPTTSQTAADVWTNCILPQTKPTGAIPFEGHLNEAFMFNPTSNPLDPCVQSVNSLLKLGVSSETCARYYVDGNKYKMAFRKCSECCS